MVTAAIAATLLMQKPEFIPCVQAWTFHRFTTEQAIAKAAQAGSTAIELFPGQDFSKDMPGVKVGPEMGADATQKLKAFLAQSKLRVVAFGVTGISKDPAEARKLFAWAKDLGILVINTESTDAIDTVESMVKEFDIKVGYHNHPKQPNNPNYKVWDPAYVYDLVKNRDKRIGSCADTGHWVRSGIKPTDAIKTLKGRIVSSHLKDLHEFTPNGHDMPFGLGVSDINGILNEYTKMKLQGPASVEYEHNWDDNVNEVAQCIGFLRAFHSGH